MIVEKMTEKMKHPITVQIMCPWCRQEREGEHSCYDAYWILQEEYDALARRCEQLQGIVGDVKKEILSCKDSVWGSRKTLDDVRDILLCFDKTECEEADRD